MLDAFVARARGVARSIEGSRRRPPRPTTSRAANELRTALLSAVSHDLRTPLAAIKASVTSLLAGRHRLDARRTRDEFLATIDEETDRLNGLVGNLLDMSRLQTGALEVAAAPVGLDEVVPAALAQHRRAARTRVDVDVPETLPRSSPIPALLERAIANVVTTPWSTPPARRYASSPAPSTASVDLRVVDRGPGVPPTTRPRLPAVPAPRRQPAAARASGSGSPSRSGFVEAMGGSSRSRTRRAAG